MVLSMERWKGKVAVVTGASDGIGAAVTERLINEGIIVVGLARNKDKLEKLSQRLTHSPGKFHYVQTDITKEQDIINSFNWIKTNLGPIHILINCAGLFVMTSLSEGKTDLWKKVFDTNVLGLCTTTREAIKDMKENKTDGHIIHLNSLGGHSVTCWQMNVYSASKYAVTALTETLRQELNSIGSKIKISSISPGYVSTEMVSTSAVTTGVAKDEHWLNWEQNALALQPKDVADAIAYVLSTPSHVQVHELKLRAIF